jgi:hypothetical protein
MRTRRVDPNTATKGAQVREVGFGTMTVLEGGGSGVATRQCILDSQVSMKGIRPKPGIETSASEGGAKDIPNGLMSLLNGFHSDGNYLHQ